MSGKWKKFLTCFLTVAMLITMSTPLAFAADQVRIIDQGSFLQFEVPPQIIKGRTMVPMREIFENVFGCSVEWNSAEKSITAVYPDTTPITIQMKIGDQTMYVNGKAVLIDVPPQIVSGKTLVPLKAISSSLGVGIGYDNAHKVVVLGLATDNPQEVLAIDAQNYTDIKLTDMYGDIDLLKLYTVPSPDAAYMYEVKGHPYESQYQALLTIKKEGSVFIDVSVEKLNKPDMNKKVTWTDVNGTTYTHTVDSLYTLFPLLEMKNGQTWCLKTFGDVYSEYQDIPGRVLLDAIQSYAKTYL
ncbi:copper amine oxidase N-terminal domain-containing protein [Aminipila butyrica]|uniref:Copper amine oxidase N-terminal domain-containing protein n=1 Tax=Aminipila butyrica TaxID=433296 RepID=A0A858BV45_9FIRM|nr:stalk domain-containing protein [Aminipila butyrica]QIB69921.1 copper amine oxidase N-terminal domain-containing protein [Aminipila butyrica]